MMMVSTFLHMRREAIKLLEQATPAKDVKARDNDKADGPENICYNLNR